MFSGTQGGRYGEKEFKTILVRPLVIFFS